MFFKHQEKFSVLEILTRTIFLTTVVSFFVFLAFDLFRPGFVSNTFSIHWFLLVAIVSGIWWAGVVKERKENKILQFLSAFIFGLAGVFVVWQFRANLSDFLVLVLPLALVVPLLVIYLLASPRPR
ncbi:MAG: hypothetical protein WC702_01570 [Patescibacteria group bacterium]|jgi:hypothetical protein